jgi:hypothetical protein
MPNCRSGLAGTFDLVARLSARDIVEVDMLMTDSTQVTALVTKRKDEIRLVLTEQWQALPVSFVPPSLKPTLPLGPSQEWHVPGAVSAMTSLAQLTGATAFAGFLRAVPIPFPRFWGSDVSECPKPLPPDLAHLLCSNLYSLTHFSSRCFVTALALLSLVN